MPTSTIQLPTGLIDGIITQASYLFAQFSPFIALIGGVLLALVAIEFLINAIRHK